MRSASWGVVIEPSTRERSYGPRTVAREASGKWAISISPATVSNSSSQSSRLNWQPSQEANFQTASVGFCCWLILYLPLRQQMLHTTIWEDRPIPADKIGLILAVPTETNGTFHIALQRD